MENTELKDSYWILSPQDLLVKLQSGKDGIPDAEAERRLAASKSKIKVPSQFRRDVVLFFSQFKSPLVLLLVVAVVLSALLGQGSDVVIILFILSATGILSFLQERNAGKAVEKLRSMISTQVNVIRNGVEKQIPGTQIAPGDILVVESGDILPADCILLESKDLYANESSLTGESYPAEKETGISEADAGLSKRKNVLFQGSSIVSGKAKALVVLTGIDTVMGQTAQHLSAPVEETAFEKGIRQFGYLLMRVTVFLAILILILNIAFHKPVFDSMLFSLALAIGMAPELLPAIMTIAMSRGAKRMADQKVIIKKLSSIQNLGEVNVLCSDKTGTLTDGVLKIESAIDTTGKESLKVKTYAYLNALFETGFPNPMDEALRGMQGIDVTGYTKADEVPYDFIRKRLSVLVTKEEKTILICKGAYKNIIEVCTHAELADGTIVPLAQVQQGIESLYQKYSNEGFRAIGVCYKNLEGIKSCIKDDEQGMIIAGFVHLFDPPKPDVIDTVNKLHEIGISFKMITGDNQLVAAYIAKQIGIPDPVILTGGELQKISPEALVQRAQQTNIFAEIEPQQKERIILALRKAGNTVAYMGDGINDVSAINAADVGISINNAVDVAKDAADVVLLEKDLLVLHAGVLEGRRTFVNTLKYIYINTGATFGDMFSVAIVSLVLPFLPMLPEQILMTNFLTDYPYMAVASDNVDEDQVHKPQRWQMKQIKNFMIVFGLHSAVFHFITFWVLYGMYRTSPGIFQSAWFLEEVFVELLILFIVRTHHSIFRSRPGRWLFILNLTAFVITLILLFTPAGHIIKLQPLPGQLIAIISGILLAYTITAEMLKLVFFKNSD